MPKIFLLKKRMHDQQLGLQEGQELLTSKADMLCPGSPLDDGPIALLSKKDNECAGKSPQLEPRRPQCAHSSLRTVCV